MKNNFITEYLKFHYQLIVLSDIDYRVFLDSPYPEEQVYAILANFGKENEDDILEKIIHKVADSAQSDFAQRRYFTHLRILAQLRQLNKKLSTVMESITEFFKIEEDPFYIRGKKKGSKRGSKKGR